MAETLSAAEIAALTGRDLDRAVGERLCGYTVYRYDKDYEANCYYCLMNADFTRVHHNHWEAQRKTEAQAWEDCPPFSGEIASAWALAEHLREQGWLVTLKAIPDGEPFWLADDDPRARVFRPYSCVLTWMRRETVEGTRRYIHAHPHGFGDTPGEAICRAALGSLGQ